MSFTDALENAILDHVFGGPDYTRPATVWLGLSTTTPDDAGGNFTEPVGGNYARVTITNSGAEWNAAASGSKTNINNLLFAQATAGWGTITHWGLFDVSSGGTALLTGSLSISQAVIAGDIPAVAPGEVVINLD